MKNSVRLARIIKVLSVPARVRIVQLLKGRALCVKALAARMDITQGAVSQHLRIMRDADLLRDEKRGYYVHYCLNEQTLAGWRESIDKLLDPEQGAGLNPKGAPSCAAARTPNKPVKCRKT